EPVDVVATIFADGHDVLVAVLRDRHEPGFGIRGSGFVTEPAKRSPHHERIPKPESRIPSAEWRETPMAMAAPGTDRWTARFGVGSIGWQEYQIVGWIDRFLTWRRDVRIKAAARQDVSIELLEGSRLVREAAGRAADRDAAAVLEFADLLSDSSPAADRL